RLVALELHPEDAAALSRLFQRDPQVTVRQGDGYAALKALLPPKERRGLVLIDPPFEEKDEFGRVVDSLREAHRRWATGHYVVWYPVKDRQPVAAFHDALKATGVTRILVVELLLRPDDDPKRLNGTGLILVNPPWPLEDKLQGLLPALADLLGTEPGGGTRVEWLVPEAPKKPAA
ncbi:MAG TPA: 23S rRNA (adenine(2030)-N(6))-methyltransferase RlmJ, partial [Kiloniellaceae bacterium]|nr:23S rRNA (adenine(2030)-N(6))-methyltransferase RlmJ [Kiloniellaceae bacterium]